MVSLDSLKLFRNEPLLKTLSKVLFFQFPNGPSCSPPSPNNVAFRFDSANVYIEVHSRLHKTFILRFSLFSTMRTKKEQSIDYKTSVLRTTCPKKAALHTCGTTAAAAGGRWGCERTLAPPPPLCGPPDVSSATRASRNGVTRAPHTPPRSASSSTCPPPALTGAGRAGRGRRGGGEKGGVVDGYGVTLLTGSAPLSCFGRRAGARQKKEVATRHQ